MQSEQNRGYSISNKIKDFDEIEKIVSSAAPLPFRISRGDFLARDSSRGEMRSNYLKYSAQNFI